MTRRVIDQFRAAAYHEAGHAVLVRRHGRAIRKEGVWINRDGYGATHYHRLDPAEAETVRRNGSQDHWERFRRDLFAEIEIALAGWLAECRYHGIDAQAGRAVRYAAEDAVERIEVAHFNDISVAANIIAACLRAENGPAPVEAGAVVRTYNRVKATVARTMFRPRTWSAVEAVAEALISRHRLDAPEIEAILTAIPLPRARAACRIDRSTYRASDRRSQSSSTISPTATADSI